MNKYALSTDVRNLRISVTRSLVCGLSAISILLALAVDVYRSSFSPVSADLSCKEIYRADPASDKDSLAVLRYYVESYSEEAPGTSELAPSESDSGAATSSAQAEEEASPSEADAAVSDGGIELLPGQLRIDERDLSGDPGDRILLKNETGYSPDMQKLLDGASPGTTVFQSSRKSTEGSGDPLVLIIHTHGTEGYADEGATALSAGDMPRSDDIESNVVAVGDTLSKELGSRGIEALHCTVMHDKESYLNAYTNAKNTILYYLAKYPSIKYVLDLHRDAIITAENEAVKGVVYSDGAPCAQIMFVVGTDENGADHPEWETNLSVAARIQSKLNELYPNIARPINLRGPSFNEQYTSGSLLIEIGTCANTLGEAKRSATLLAQAFCELISEK